MIFLNSGQRRIPAHLPLNDITVFFIVYEFINNERMS